MRPSWDVTWMTHAITTSKRSRCVLAQIGAVIVTQENRLIATGYSGPPARLISNRDMMCDNYCPRSGIGSGGGYDTCVHVHAEVNALLFCDRKDREGGKMYVNAAPCWDCCKIIANSGLVEVVYMPDKVRSPGGISLMQSSGLVVRTWT